MSSATPQRDVVVLAGRPEPGQLVRVRDRHWVVGSVQRATISPEGTTLPEPPTLVDLVSVEDDDFISEMRVLWEVEPGTQVLETATLPRPVLGQLDDPARLDAFLDAVRWGAITSAESTALQSPFRSGIEIQTYQLDPLVRALRAPRVNLLIADDVGLGKTIEAGLVAQELLLRHRARSMLIVSPAGLTPKWRMEMLEKFGLEFTVIDDALLRQLRRERGVAANAFTHFPRLIISIDRLKRPRYMRLVRDAIAGADPSHYPRRFDLLIVDEVHQCAPSGRGQYAIDSQRTRTIDELSLHFEHRLFLSATPHNGYQESFTALLELLDPQRFARGVPPAREAVEQVMVRRLKRELRDELAGTEYAPRFPRREIVELPIEPSADERRMHELIERYAASRRQASATRTTQVANGFVTLLLKKRLLSSPDAFARTLDHHRRSMAEGRKPSPDAAYDGLYDEIETDFEDEEEKLEATDAAERRASRALEPLTPDQKAILDELAELAELARRSPDSKLESLLVFLLQTCTSLSGGRRTWNDERAIVFTEYRDTLFYIEEQLKARLNAEALSVDAVELIHGGTDTDKRARIINEFQTDPVDFPVRVLLATDAASEGIDLQRQCHRIVHVETPFSPNRLEQRNGRIDRHGQPSPVALIHHFVPAGFEQAPHDSLEGDLQFLRLVAHKVEQIRDDLGSAGDVLADRVQRRLGRGESVDIDAPLPKRRRDSAEITKLRRDLERDLQRLRDALDRSVDELGITPATVRRVVETGLDLARQPRLRATRLARKDGEVDVFDVPSLAGTWQDAVSDLPHPAKVEVRRPITFDHAVAEGHDDVVLVHLGHRLSQRALRLLRAEIWASTEDRTLSRVTARVVDSNAATWPALIAHARLVITGGAGKRLHEQVISAGGELVEGRFRAFRTVGEVDALMAAATDQAAPIDIAARVIAAWDSAEAPLYSATEQRGRAVRDSILRRLDRQRKNDREAIARRMEELRASIESRLHQLEGGNVQLQLELNPEEQAQWNSDRDALRDRLGRINDDIAAEQHNIDLRYSDPTDRLFPAAVTILIPRSMVSEGT